MRAAMATFLCGAGMMATAALAQAPRPEDKPETPPITRHMVSASHPLAAEAGLEILRKGGSAVDAAIAVELALTVVDPQASGIGGGGFLLHFEGSNATLTSYDGRETAPAAATPDMLLDAKGEPLQPHAVTSGGASVAVPGLLRMLELAHRQHGRLPWGRLFEPAMRLAEDGFPVAPRLTRMIATDPVLKDVAATAGMFFDTEGNARAAGARMTNPVLAATLRAIANGGPDAFYTGAIARDIEAAIREDRQRPGVLTAADLAAYRAVEREPVCVPYRQTRICGMGPPATGGITLGEMLSLYALFEGETRRPGALELVHGLAEAARLAYADRNTFIGDPDFLSFEPRALLAPRYLAQRVKAMQADRSMGRAEPGNPFGRLLDPRPAPIRANQLDASGGAHVSVIDGAGNAVALSASLGNPFGSRVLVRGFLLNGAMAAFSARPRVNDLPVVNRIEPGKRPVSPLAPTITLDSSGKLMLILGAGGGAPVAAYIARVLVGVIDGGLDLQAAVALPHHINTNSPTRLERDTSVARLAPELQGIGHMVEIVPLVSGLQGIQVLRKGEAHRFLGASDPRRDGAAIGE